MRRLTAATAAACLVANALLAAAFVGPAAAQPSPTAPASPGGAPPEVVVPEPIPGEPVCQITDFRLGQLSGLVATGERYYAINDGSGVEGIFVLDQACQVIDVIFYPTPSRDPEDLEYDWSANVLWVGDTGDNQALGTSPGEPRQAVALWRVDLGGDRTPLIHRFRYEDGRPRDAEALILDGDGTPIIITRDIGVAELFRPVDLVPNNPTEQAVTLERVGEFTPPDTGSEHDFLPSAAARRTVTGASVSPDGSKVVVRTYTDAFEFDVEDGDVVAAITTGVPRVTPLPGEPQGEAITYTPDGEQFLTVSENPIDLADFAPSILSYTPTPPPPPAPEPADEDEPGSPVAGGGWSLFNDVQDIINLIAAVGVLGLILVGAGVFGIVRARRRWAAEPEEEKDGDEPDEPPGPVSGRARPPGAESPPGWQQQPSQSGGHAGGVYSSSAARDGESGYEGTEYGGGHGTEYGQGTDHPGTQYRGTEYGGGQQSAQYAGGYPDAGYAGTAYGGYGEEHAGGYTEAAGSNGYHGGGYHHADEPYDQDWPGDQLAQGHQGGGYAEGEYGQAGYGYPPPDAGGTYQSEGYHGGGYEGSAGQQPAGNDYYSDDPDYPYEFRERDRW